MPDTNAPLRREKGELDDQSIEGRIRLVLGKLGREEAFGRGGLAGIAASSQIGAKRRICFAGIGDVPVECVPPTARLVDEVGCELAEKRAE